MSSEVEKYLHGLKLRNAHLARLTYQIRSSALISFAIIRFRSNLTACGTGRASAIQYRDVRSLTCRNLATLRWLKPSLAIAAPYCWPVMALRFTIIWGFGRMRYRNPRIQVLLLCANDLGFRAETLGFRPLTQRRPRIRIGGIMGTVPPLPVAPGSQRPTTASGYVDGRHGGDRSQREVRLLLPPHHQERREDNK